MTKSPKRNPIADEPYVWVRPESRFLWFRMAVPKEVREKVGRSFIAQSLGTADRREAAALAGRRRAELLEEWGLITPSEASPIVRRVPTSEELEALAVDIAHDAVTEYEDRRRRSLRGVDAKRWRRHVERTEINLAEQSRLTASGDPAIVKGFADIAIEELGLDLPQGSEAYNKFVDDLNVARLAALRVSHDRVKGNVEAEADSKLVQKVREQERTKAKAGESILELFERWAELMLAKGEKRPDTVNQDRKAIEQFAAFVGKDRAIDSITRLDVRDYRNTLRNLPPKWMYNKQLQGMDMRTAAVKARELGLSQLAFTTVNKHLSTISPLYDWLRSEEWPTLSNPVDGLFYDKVKGKNRRPSFDTDALNRMLRSPLFTGFRADGYEHQAGNKHANDWRKWVPLACMFTGARIGEIAQLRIGDVREERGVWFIHICHEEKDGLTTKNGEGRSAVVHSMLEKIGFLTFREHQLKCAGGALDAPLFPELEPNARGQISGMASRWWREYLESIGVKNGADGIGAHSFRHTLADLLRNEAELLDNQIAICLGHNQKTTTSGYGKLSQGTVTMLKEWIERVRFDGVNFDHLLLHE
jgi:integrase